MSVMLLYANQTIMKYMRYMQNSYENEWNIPNRKKLLWKLWNEKLSVKYLQVWDILESLKEKNSMQKDQKLTGWVERWDVSSYVSLHRGSVLEHRNPSVVFVVLHSWPTTKISFGMQTAIILQPYLATHCKISYLYEITCTYSKWGTNEANHCRRSIFWRRKKQSKCL